MPLPIAAYIPPIPADGKPPDAWDRSWHAWTFIFYALLTLSVGIVLLDRPWTGRHALILALSACLLLGHWAIVIRDGPRCDRYGRKVLYCGGAIVLWTALVFLHPAFFLLLFALYAQVYQLLPLRTAITASAILTTAMVWRNIATMPSSIWPTLVLSGLIAFALGSWFAYWLSTIIRQSGERRLLIEQLEATRRELAVSERQAGSMAERQRLAGEIHDTLAQGFVSVVMHLEAADAAIERHPAATAALRQHLDDARRVARENLTEARRLVWALRPELLVGSTLTEALDRVVQRWGEENRVAAAFTVTGEACQLPPEHEVTLLRAAQEALANARKHAAATEVVVTLSYLDTTAILDVQDDGTGFDPLLPVPLGQTATGGYGLRGLRERVEALGGTLSVESAPDEGTTLAIELPTTVGSEQLVGASVSP